jgi:hypothetical protein
MYACMHACVYIRMHVCIRGRGGGFKLMAPETKRRSIVEEEEEEEQQQTEEDSADIISVAVAG